MRVANREVREEVIYIRRRDHWASKDASAPQSQYIACCQKLEHLTINWDVDSYNEASEALKNLLSALRTVPRLAVITLSALALGFTREDTEIDVDQFAPIEEALLEMDALEKVELSFESMTGSRPDWYSDFMEEHVPRLLPTLHGRDMVVF